MNDKNISKKILYWYDNNKRSLPWRAKCSFKKKQYYAILSEFMLQQTQVKTVIPYFINFLKYVPNIEALAKLSEKRLLKLWQGLGYYSRAKNLKRSAQILVSNYNSQLPNTYENLKSLPGIGDYTANAILAIVFDKPTVPLDGNIERLLKRILNLKSEIDIKKKNLNRLKKVFGQTNRSGDYAQALMELGSLICKPKIPICVKCPITKNCLSYKKKDFKLKSKNKKTFKKFYIATLYKKQNRILLVKNEKFKFLKNLLIFPMKEIKKPKTLLKSRNQLNLKISNMNMNILIDFSKNKIRPKNGLWIETSKLKNYMIPNFTKKIFATARNNL